MWIINIRFMIENLINFYKKIINILNTKVINILGNIYYYLVNDNFQNNKKEKKFKN